MKKLTQFVTSSEINKRKNNVGYHLRMSNRYNKIKKQFYFFVLPKLVVARGFGIAFHVFCVGFFVLV